MKKWIILASMLVSTGCTETVDSNNTSNDMVRDMSKMDMIQVDMTNDISTDMDASADIKAEHIKIDGDINDLKTCKDVCLEANLTCDGMYNHFVDGLVGGQIKHEEVSGGLDCDDLPMPETQLLGNTYTLSSYHCYCI